MGTNIGNVQMKKYSKWRMIMKPWAHGSKCGDPMTDDDSITFIWFMVCMSENCENCVNTQNICHSY